MPLINVDTLEKIFEKIIEKLRFEKIDELELETAHYVVVSSETWTNFDNYEIDSCSLTDDIEWLNKIILEDKVCTYVDFDRLSNLLRAISQERNPV